MCVCGVKYQLAVSRLVAKYMYTDKQLQSIKKISAKAISCTADYFTKSLQSFQYQYLNVFNKTIESIGVLGLSRHVVN